MIKLITSLNWVFGALFVMVAFSYPLLNDKLITAGLKADARSVVETIAKAQRELYAARERYVYFPANLEEMQKGLQQLQLSLDVSKFYVDSVPRDGKALIVRAFTSARTLRESMVPAVIYEYVIENPGDTGQSGEVVVSQSSLSLF